jgi:hypothetical protein
MSEQKYRAKFAISQSAIKDWKDMPPQKWYDKWILKITKKKTGEALDFGTLLDTLCFSEKEFDKRFLVSEDKKPSEKVTAIVTAILEHINELNANAKKLNEKPAEEGKEKVKIPLKVLSLVDNKDIVQKFTVELDHYASKPEQGYNDVIAKGSDYFELLKKAGKRIIITQKQKELAEKLRDKLYNDPATAGFFKPKKGCFVFFQVQIFGEFPIDGLDAVESLPIKGMIDIIHVNTKRKEVREVDLKFTNDAFKFNHFSGPVRMFDYPMQHSFYDFLIPIWLKTFEDGKFADYAVMNPLNVVIDDDTQTPYVYEYNPADLRIKRVGIENTSIIGWEDTLNEIAWHLANNDWSRPKEHIVNGKMRINVFKK